MSKSKKIILIALLPICLVVLFFYYSHTKNNIPSPFSSPYVEEGVPAQSGQVEAKETNLTFTDITEGPISVYDFMSTLKNEGKINFTEKNYIGMGKFIETINGVAGNGEKNWIYYVNGNKAEIGVSNYQINNGDIVSWKYEKGY